MINVERKTKVLTGCKPDQIPKIVFSSDEPIILKGLVSGWPVAKESVKSDASAAVYLKKFYQGKSVGAFLVAPENNGRIFYNENCTGFNFDRVNTELDFALNQLEVQSLNPHPLGIYIGSASVDEYLPGFREENDLVLNYTNPRVSIWISNRCRIAAHWDSPLNIACCVAGRRRFTLFPFDQMENLYVGPLDKTPAGQEISLVDFANPDFEKFPKFQEALRNAQVADLEPGDALFLPSMWWHHVESLEPFNILVNYWFSDEPSTYSNPVAALYHAILSIRDISPSRRKAWKLMFEHYVFNYERSNFNHINEHGLGILGDLTSDDVKKIKSILMAQLNR